MMATLPPALSNALEAEFAGFSPTQIHQAAERLSLAYRGRAGIRPALTPIDRAAYLAVRFPSTFAVANLVWQEASRAIPLNGVRTVLDVGSGPGTASLAAASLVDVATAFMRFERDAGWREVADRLARACGINGRFHHGAIAREMSLGPHDVVIASYALGELPSDERDAAVAALWSLAANTLIVIEPGTPKGFEIVRRAREQCLGSGGHAAAPCTHDARCPMSMEDWCHRPIRVARASFHREAKRAELSYEDEKFAYVVMARQQPVRRAPARVVRKPIRNSGHVHLDVCEERGLKRQTIARSDGAVYRNARDASWGDLWPPHDD